MWVCIAIHVLIDAATMVLTVLTTPDGFSKIPVPTLSALITAVYAGINEEVTDRAIPLAVMMRNKPTSRRIRLSALVSTLVFSLLHAVNILQGQSVPDTIAQIIFAAGMGLFFAVVYLRTGSILLTIVIHTLHDYGAYFVLSFDATEASPIVTLLSLAAQYLPFVLGILMLRRKHHPAIIDTWSRIWPEAADEQADRSL